MANQRKATEMDMRKWTSDKKNPDGSDVPPWPSKPFAQLPTKDHIGLQSKHAGIPIFFRNLKIKAIDGRRFLFYPSQTKTFSGKTSPRPLALG